MRFILAQLRRRAGRSLALMLGVLVATTGFTVLTGSTATSRLRVTETVNANYRAAYDILVRPKGARTALEEQRGLLRPNFLSGQFGGVSMAQYDLIKSVPGVAVAAPIATVGFATAYRKFQIDLTDHIDRSATRQILRLHPTWLADRGLTVIEDTPQYVYVSRAPMYSVTTIPTGDTSLYYTDGRKHPYDPACAGRPLERLSDGRTVPVCGTTSLDSGGSGLDEAKRAAFRAFELRADGFVNRDWAVGPDVPPAPVSRRLIVDVTWRIIIAVAAIDPDQEARLVGLDRAVVSGRYLTAQDQAGPRREADLRYTGVPVLSADRAFLDENIQVEVQRLDRTAAAAVPGGRPEQLRPRLTAAPGAVLGRSERAPGELLLGYGGPVRPENPSFQLLIRAEQPSYRVAGDGALHPDAVPPMPQVWQGSPEHPYAGLVPLFATDIGFRRLSQLLAHELDYVEAEPVGTFDPGRLAGFSQLSRLPLETYQAAEATPADAATRRLLGDRPLRPNSNPAGYLAAPPLLLTTLASLPGALGPTMPAAPLSAIRVRVAGVTGFDELSRERVRRVAEDIATTTGLDVDVTVGSSLAPQTVVLPAGRYGRPELRLVEGWSKKGVAATIIQAVDRKSAVLFGLILAVCLLFLGSAVSAAVRDRRRELAILSCLGWTRRRLAALITGEVALVGLTAGALSAAAALPLAALVGVRLSATRSVLALPVAIGLALLAALVPAWRGSRAHPAAALHPSVLRSARGTRRRRTVAGLALANLARTPGRSALGAVALGVGVAGLTVLTAVAWAFRGTVTGSLLGDAVSLRVRGVDAVAVAATVLLGLFAVADVIYLNVRERAAELAALRATGWSDSALGRLVTYEGLAIGVIGAVGGAAVGLGAAAWFADGVPDRLVAVAATAAAGGAIAAGVAALVPALLQRRIPMSTLLAEE